MGEARRQGPATVVLPVVCLLVMLALVLLVLVVLALLLGVLLVLLPLLLPRLDQWSPAAAEQRQRQRQRQCASARSGVRQLLWAPLAPVRLLAPLLHAPSGLLAPARPGMAPSVTVEALLLDRLVLLGLLGLLVLLPVPSVPPRDSPLKSTLPLVESEALLSRLLAPAKLVGVAVAKKRVHRQGPVTI